MNCLGLCVFFAVVYVSLCCQDGWLTHGDKCYFFSREKETWLNAFEEIITSFSRADYKYMNLLQQMCKLLKGQLLEIEDASENAYIKTEAKIHGSDFWIALTDIQEEGTMVWMNSENHLTAESFTDWGPSQPTNAGGVENCGQINESIGYQWNDAICKSTYKYICEQGNSGTQIVG